MIKENYFPFFLFCSFLVHIVLLVFGVLEPFSGLFDKPNTPLMQTVRINSIDSLATLKTNKKKDHELPLKNSNTPSIQTKQKNTPKTVDMPKKKPLKPKKQKKSKKPTVPKKAQNNKNQTIKNIQQKQSQALDKLSALESIEKIKQEMAEQNKETPALTINNQGGNSTLDFQTLQYLTGLKAHINMYWNLPQELANQNLRSQVYAEINKTGHILQAKILKSSGNEDFDSRVLETINRASPFPSPPNREVEKLLSKGIVFNFPN